jgi:DNA-binding NarL/FixJ family response regulator
VIPAIEDFLKGLTLTGAAKAPNVPGDAARDRLSTREIEVLRLLAAGRSNQQIADELVISLNTVRRHVSNVFDKTGAANRAQATAYAKDHGIA